LLLKLHRLCTDALLVFTPDSACQSREEAQYFAAVAKIAAMLLEVLNAYANLSKDSGVHKMITGEFAGIIYIVKQVVAK